MLASRLSATPCRPAAVRPFAPARRVLPVTAAKLSTASLVQELSKDQLKPYFPAIQVGDTIKLGLAVKEANGKTRTQTLEGVIIGEHGSGLNRTLTFRRLFQGIGVELVLHVNSPVLLSVELVRRGRTRRAKLNYLRERLGKAAKLKEVVAGKYSTTNAKEAIKVATKGAAAAAATAAKA